MAKRRRYWDAVTFLGWFNEEEDKKEDCAQVIDAAESKKVTIVTSAITLAEVVYIRNNTEGVRLSKDMHDTLRAFFQNDYIEIWNADRFICERAQEMMWKYDDLRHKDAIHAATAVQADVKSLDTYDPDLLGIDGQLVRPDGSTLRIGPPKLEDPSLFPGTAIQKLEEADEG